MSASGSAAILYKGLSLILEAWPDAKVFVDGDTLYVSAASAAKGVSIRITGENHTQLQKLGWTDGGDEWSCLLETFE